MTSWIFIALFASLHASALDFTPPSKGELMLVKSSDGVLGLDHWDPKKTRRTSRLPENTLVQVLKRDLRDPEVPGQVFAQIYTPDAALCSHMDRPCYVSFNPKDFTPVVFEFVPKAMAAVKETVRAATQPPKKPCNPVTFVVPPPARNTLSSSLKSDAELLRYFTCFQSKAVHTENYRKEYSSYLWGASGAFSMPSSLSACVIFRESKWDKDAMNPKSSARGLGQILKGTHQEIVNLLAKGELTPEKIKELTRILDQSEKSAKPEAPKIESTLLVQQRTTNNFGRYQLNAMLTKHEMGLDLTPVNYRDPNARFNPEIAVGMTTLYLRYIHERLVAAMIEAGNPEAKNAYALLQSPEYLSIVVSGYYLGPGGVKKLLGTALKQPTSEWVSHLKAEWARREGMLQVEIAKNRNNKKRTDELTKELNELYVERNYSESMRRCITRGDGRPLADGAKPSEVHSCRF